jgi:hypothetical protein
MRLGHLEYRMLFACQEGQNRLPYYPTLLCDSDDAESHQTDAEILPSFSNVKASSIARRAV